MRMEGAPKITDHLCDDCRAHYEAVKDYLDAAGIAYVEDSRLVRGLDYYTRTVFEFQVDTGMGSQNAIGGGGRYDKLAKEVGGRDTPGLGFALGYERCVLALEALGAKASSEVRLLHLLLVSMTLPVQPLSTWRRSFVLRGFISKWITRSAA